ncbi:hypothetical protein XPA_001964 [Xanthoria parietina]
MVPLKHAVGVATFRAINDHANAVACPRDGPVRDQSLTPIREPLFTAKRIVKNGTTFPQQRLPGHDGEDRNQDYNGGSTRRKAHFQGGFVCEGYTVRNGWEISKGGRRLHCTEHMAEANQY